MGRTFAHLLHTGGTGGGVNFQQLIFLVVGFVLGLLSGLINDYIKDRRSAAKLSRILDVELEELACRLIDTAKSLQAVPGPSSWFERELTFIGSWFWAKGDALALLPRKTLSQLTILRGLLQRLEQTYREIEQDIGADGRMFPREHVLRNFDRLKNHALSRTERLQTLIQQIRRDLTHFPLILSRPRLRPKR